MSDTFIGQEIDGFRVLDELGRGGMGVVYKAEDVALARPVALKMIARDLARDESFVRRFRSEARALARINSPHITSIYALRRTDVGIFIVMEYIGGGTLGDRMEMGPLAWRTIRPIVLEMITALEHAHGVGVIHRDIKPGNILLTESSHVKVTDFGLAKLHAADKGATVTQGIAGTLYYMSPEQVKGERNLDGRSDLYALGVTLYEVLSGRLPFDRGGSEFATMRKIVEDAYPPLGQYAPNLPPGLEAAVMKALEKNPDDRYANASAMRAAFEAIPAEAAGGASMASHREAATVVAGTAYAPPPSAPGASNGAAPPAGSSVVAADSSKRGLMIGGGVVAALVAIAALAFLLWPSGPETRLSVRTDPPGATVYLNDEVIGRTPLNDAAVRGGEGQLRLERAGYAFVDTTLTFVEGEEVDMQVPLVAMAPGEAPASVLEITSDPSGAAVFVNEERVGETPYTYRDRSGRPLSVRVERDGYTPYIRRGIILSPSDPQSLDATLERTATASTTPPQPSPSSPVSTPSAQPPAEDPPPAQLGTVTLNVVPNGTVRIAGQSRENSGTFRVAAGRQAVTCEHPLHGTFNAGINVPANGETSATCYFNAKVNVNANLADGRPTWGGILVDGRRVGETTPQELTLPVGTHTISVQRDGFQTLTPEQTVVIEPGLEQQVERVAFRLQRQ